MHRLGRPAPSLITASASALCAGATPAGSRQPAADRIHVSHPSAAVLIDHATLPGQQHPAGIPVSRQVPMLSPAPSHVSSWERNANLLFFSGEAEKYDPSCSTYTRGYWHVSPSPLVNHPNIRRFISVRYRIARICMYVVRLSNSISRPGFPKDVYVAFRPICSECSYAVKKQ